MTATDEAAAPAPTMRTKIVDEYKTLASLHRAEGPFLEITAGSRQTAISAAPFMAGRERHVIFPGQGGEADGISFHKGNPNDMSALFDDECFSTVIWDRALERDAFFWLTLAEIKRVLMPGGVLMVCTHAFAKSNKFGIKVAGANGNPVPFLVATGKANATAADYWRLSPQGMRKVILNGFDVREVRISLMIPHLFAVGTKER